MTTLSKADLETDVWGCLARVTDPELDEPLTDLGFVESVAVVDNQRVEVGFRLPTYGNRSYRFFIHRVDDG